jgi:hypothetical protein
MSTTNWPPALSRRGVNPGFVFGMTAYFVCLAAGIAIVDVTHPPRAIAAAIAVPPVAAAIYAVTSQFRFVRRTEGVERTSATEAAAFTFYVVVLTALAYFFLETWAKLPLLSMLWVWVYGIMVYGIATSVLSRRMR